MNERDGELPLFGSASGTRAPRKPERPKYLTVTELTTRIRGVLEPSFAQIWVQGEISNFRPAASGHVYFSLKDEGASISAALFGWGRGKRPFELKDGLQVLCRGKISVYPPRGNYQITVDSLEPLGAGALQLAFEQLKAKLGAEGLFDPSRKKRLPPFPNRIVVVTSPTGSVIQDMLNILRRRAPHLEVLVIPALVQGDEAPNQIVSGLETANCYALGDLVILARGGGSMEDLWCFNNERVVRAIAASKLPVISAVGHETDFTISDFVADLRAPTPSAAAEIVSGYWVEAVGRIQEHGTRIRNAMIRDLATRKTLFAHLSARLVSPRDRLREQAQRLDELSLRLERAMIARVERRRAALEQFVAKLDALSPLRVLERGYSIVRGAEGRKEVIRSASQVAPGQKLEVRFHDGQKLVQALS